MRSIDVCGAGHARDEGTVSRQILMQLVKWTEGEEKKRKEKGKGKRRGVTGDEHERRRMGWARRVCTDGDWRRRE
ncbi:hypothetical protein PDE_08261 [Penicillium oxalicum 114-2]|uniref:Uncharacterized protein n=1 Tax=Penicillium oxalicum (strain 114-2 / CGMCC 5302) TaxID=933388 RepID=S7ZSC0_PENO1|nr:hypothetical protein PDE_08261 [Penicillium oxalicum 114-2]